MVCVRAAPQKFAKSTTYMFNYSHKPKTREMHKGTLVSLVSCPNKAELEKEDKADLMDIALAMSNVCVKSWFAPSFLIVLHVCND